MGEPPYISGGPPPLFPLRNILGMIPRNLRYLLCKRYLIGVYVRVCNLIKGYKWVRQGAVMVAKPWQSLLKYYKHSQMLYKFVFFVPFFHPTPKWNIPTPLGIFLALTFYLVYKRRGLISLYTIFFGGPRSSSLVSSRSRKIL